MFLSLCASFLLLWIKEEPYSNRLIFVVGDVKPWFQTYVRFSITARKCLQAKAAVNYSMRGSNCHHKVTGCVGGPSFYTLSKQTPKQRVNMTNGPSLPLFLGAPGVRSFDFRLGCWDVAKATFATGGHVGDVLQAVVQWARSRGVWEGEVFQWQSETSLH